MNDDELIARMRAALDEAATTAMPTDEMPLATAAPSTRGRWMAVAAAVALVAGGVAAIALNRGTDDATSVASSTTLLATTIASTTPVTAGEGSWYELDLSGFTAEEATYTPCCPPTPAPGPATVMAWGSLESPLGGVLTLTATPAFDGGAPTLVYAWTDMTDERAAELQAKVVPGSGLPYVLDDLTMGVIGIGFAGMGELTAQRYTSADGTIELRIGDYTGQYDHLINAEHVAITVDGTPGYVVDTPAGRVVLWQPTPGDWAELIISAGVTVGTEEILAALRPAPRPAAFTPTTVTLAPPTTVLPSTEYRGNVGGIIDNGDGRGPMLTFFWLDSLPPQGGSLPLAGFDWDMVEGEQTLNGVTWLEESVGVTGTFDGTTFTLTEPVSGPFTFTDDVLTYGTLTEGCTEADVAPALAALNALDQQALGLIESSDYVWDGHCGVQVYAMFDTPELRDALATLGDDVMVRIAFQPVV